MRRLATFLAAALTAGGLMLLPPVPAAAIPMADLCVPDNTRGGVPWTFVIDACAEVGSVTMRNSLGFPVLVQGTGDVGTPVRHYQRRGATEAVLRLTAGPGTVLVPGDVVRWPLGTGAADFTVSLLQPTATAPVVDTLEPFLPNLGTDDVDQDDYRVFGTLARELAVAVDARAACVPGKNFLQVAACDVTGASEVSRAAIAQLPRRTALQLLAVAQDPTLWADWSAPQDGVAFDPAVLLHLPQTAQPVPVPPAPVPAPAAARVPAGPAAPASSAAPTWNGDFGQLLEKIQEWRRSQEGGDDGGGNGNDRGYGNGK